MKTISIAGRVGKDAVTRDTGQSSVTGFSVAVDEGYGDKKTTLWFDCSMWGKRGDAVARFLNKGTPVSLSGELSRREHEGKTYLTINVQDLTLQGKSEGQSHQPSGGESPADTGDDIPFMREDR